MNDGALDGEQVLSRVREGSAPASWTIIPARLPSHTNQVQALIVICVAPLVAIAFLVYTFVQGDVAFDIFSDAPCLFFVGLFVWAAVSTLRAAHSPPGRALVLTPEGVVEGNYRTGRVRRALDFATLRAASLASETSPYDEDGPETTLSLVHNNGRVTNWKVDENYGRDAATSAILAAYARYRAEHEPVVSDTAGAQVPAPQVPAPQAPGSVWASQRGIDAVEVLRRVATGSILPGWRVIPGVPLDNTLQLVMLAAIGGFVLISFALPAIGCLGMGVSYWVNWSGAGWLFFAVGSLAVIGLFVWTVVAVSQRVGRRRQAIRAQALVLMPEGFVVGYPATGVVSQVVWYRDLASISVEPGDRTYGLRLTSRAGLTWNWGLERRFGNRDRVVQEIMTDHARALRAEREQTEQ